MAKDRILVVDDEESMCQYLAILLRKEDYEVTTVNSGVQALQEIGQGHFDLVMTDIQMPKMDGIQLLKGIKALNPATPVIIMTAYASEQSAIDAVNLGAFSYLQKHCKNDEIRMVVRNALALGQARSENQELKKKLTKSTNAKKIIGQSPRMHSVSRTQQSGRWTFCGHQLWRHSRNTFGKPTVRAHQRIFHRRRPGP